MNIKYWIEEFMLLIKHLPMPIPVLDQELELERTVHDLESQISLKLNQLGQEKESQLHFNNKLFSFHKIQVLKRARIWRLELLFLQNTKEQYDSNTIRTTNQ